MKAMLLAAGRGTRVRPITDTVPKPMIPVINKPVMAFLIDLLRQHGFDEIVVSTSYLAHEIESYFGDGEAFGVHIAYSFEGYHVDGQPVAEGWGSAGGLKKLQEFSRFFDGTFAVVCGDAIIDLDLTEAVRQHREIHTHHALRQPRREGHQRPVLRRPLRTQRRSRAYRLRLRGRRRPGAPAVDRGSEDPHGLSDGRGVQDVSRTRLTLPNRVESVRPATAFLVQTARALQVAPAASPLFEVAVTEALSNAVKHGQSEASASTITCEIELAPRELMLRVFDSGPGFVVPADARLDINPDEMDRLPESGYGLPIIQSVFPIVRAIRVDGRFGLELCLPV